MKEYLQKATKRDVQDVFDELKGLHTVYRHHRRGYSNDRDKSLRRITSIPVWCIFDPEHKKYFDPAMDRKERDKSIDAWIKKNDWFDFRKL